MKEDWRSGWIPKVTNPDPDSIYTGFRRLQQTKSTLSNRDILNYLARAESRVEKTLDRGRGTRELAAECLRFTRVFYLYYGDRMGLFREMDRRFGDLDLFDLAEEYSNWLDRKKDHYPLDARQKSNCLKVSRYIFNLKGDVNLCYSSSDDSLAFFLMPAGSKDPEGDAIELKAIVSHLARREGQMLVTSYLSKGPNLVNGFEFVQGEIMLCTPAYLRLITGGGSPDSDYQVAPLKLDYLLGDEQP